MTGGGDDCGSGDDGGGGSGSGGGGGGGGSRVRLSNFSRKILSFNPPRFIRTRHRSNHVTIAPSHHTLSET